MNLPMWFSNMLSWAAQVGLLALAAALLLRLFRILEPRFLLVLWRSLLVVSLALPLLQPWHRPASITAVAVISGADTFSFSAPPPARTHWHFPDVQVISNAIGIAIIAGILLRFALLALGLLKLRRFRESSTPIADAAESAAILKQMRANVGASADFRLSRDVESPVTFGLARPVILLPERFLATDARFQLAIACHELLHVRRRDWAHHLAEEIVRASLWFHPAIAWFISRVRLAREQLVDLEVLTVTSARKVYLEALLEFSGSRTRMAAVPTAISCRAPIR
jgi:beta-lactamase regulating signal transducer with metallopeptidase domain